VTPVLHSSRDVSAVLLAARQLSSYLLHLSSALTRHTWLSWFRHRWVSTNNENIHQLLDCTASVPLSPAIVISSIDKLIPVHTLSTQQCVLWVTLADTAVNATDHISKVVVTKKCDHSGHYLQCKRGKVLRYLLPSTVCGAGPVVQAVNPQVTLSHPPGSRLRLLTTRPAVTLPPKECHHP